MLLLIINHAFASFLDWFRAWLLFYIGLTIDMSIPKLNVIAKRNGKLLTIAITLERISKKRSISNKFTGSKREPNIAFNYKKRTKHPNICTFEERGRNKERERSYQNHGFIEICCANLKTHTLKAL